MYDEWGDEIYNESEEDEDDYEDKYPQEQRDWLKDVGKRGRMDVQMRLAECFIHLQISPTHHTGKQF